jgi:23S rRNA pseudouridine1911/1915/1917 synthase
MNIPIAYEDAWLVIVDKPAGLLTVPTPRNERRTLESVLNEERRRPEEPQWFPCHRLDRETSGLLIFAKGKEMQGKMMDQFRSRRVKKTYTAFVQGKVAGHGRITVPVDGSQAFTRYHVTRSGIDFSVVKAFPETGRKNQIRIHFKAAGHPVVGESKFAFRKDFRLRAKRAMLHAESLEFDHPVTKKHVKVFAELPMDMRRFLEEHE